MSVGMREYTLMIKKLKTGLAQIGEMEGGLHPGLGGRSRYYQGVLLPIEGGSLTAWPADLRAILTGDGVGAYTQVVRDLESRFPEIQDRPLVEAAHELGLMHLPQAAVYNAATHQFHAYSPVTEALRQVRANELTVIKGAVHKLISQRDGLWSVEVRTGPDESHLRGGFDACVLGASAIGNVQILAETFEQEITTTISDHLSVGAIVRLRTGTTLGVARHPKLWTGYQHLPVPGCNVFVQEMPPLPNGDRIVDINAVIEQGESSADYSTLFVVPERPTTQQYTHIEGKLSLADMNRVRLAVAAISGLANAMSDGDPIEYEDSGGGDYGQCLIRAKSNAAGSHKAVLYPYQFTYGAFEHESSTTPAGGTGAVATTSTLEFRNLPGVFAVGPGVYPRPGVANPALTLLAISRMVAALIHQRYT